jgi:simple sugar transport system permease protein
VKHIKIALSVVVSVIGVLSLRWLQPDVFTIAFGSPVAILRLLTIASPLLITGLAVHASLINGRILIAGEGVYAAGGLTVALVGTSLSNTPLGLWAGLVAAFAIGSGIGFLISWLREVKGVHEVISGLLLNYVLQLLTRFLASGPLRDPVSDAPHTRELLWTLPLLSANSDVNVGLVLGCLVTSAYIYVLHKTVMGRYIRSLGTTDGVAYVAGINPVKTRMMIMAGAAGLIGIAGAISIGSAGPFRRFPADFYGSGVGFDGLVVGLLAGPSAWLLVPSTLLMGCISHLSDALSLATSLPRQFGSLAGALVFLAAAFFRYRKQPRN